MTNGKFSLTNQVSETFIAHSHSEVCTLVTRAQALYPDYAASTVFPKFKGSIFFVIHE